MLLSKKGQKINRIIWMVVSVIAVIGMIAYLIIPLF